MKRAAPSSTPAANTGSRRPIPSGRRSPTGSTARSSPIEQRDAYRRAAAARLKGSRSTRFQGMDKAPPFRYYLRVRYVECDAQKVVFNTRYGEYVDVSVNEFLRAIGMLPAFTDGHLDFQLVKQTTEWKAP